MSVLPFMKLVDFIKELPPQCNTVKRDEKLCDLKQSTKRDYHFYIYLRYFCEV